MYNYQSIPLELRNQKRWVLWKKTEKGKIPINAVLGKMAKSNDINTWCDYNTALNVYLNNPNKYNGIGIMLGNGLVGIDLDHLNFELDKVLINDFINNTKSYTELSQSGEGLHILVKGIIPEGKRRHNNIEMYDNFRFFALTGNIFQGLKDLKEVDLTYLFNKYLNFEENKIVQKEINTKVSNTLLMSDTEILEKARQSKNGVLFSQLYDNGDFENLYNSQSEADIALCIQLAFWTNCNFDQMDRLFRNSGLYREKWDRKTGESTYGEITLNNAIKYCNNTYQPKERKYEAETYTTANNYFVFSRNNNTTMFALPEEEQQNRNALVSVDNTIDNIKNNALTKGGIKEINSETGEIIKSYDLTDTGNAERFIDTFGENFKYNVDNKKWMWYNGKYWQNDETQEIKRKCDLLIEKMKVDVVREKDSKMQNAMLSNIKRLASNTGKEAMLKEAQHLLNIPIQNKDFNKNPYLLCCENGIVNLKTGYLIDFDKDLLINKSTHIEYAVYDDDKIIEEWIHFINTTFSYKTDLINFIQKAIGYTLTGLTKEQCFFQCYGIGSNGKSTLFNIIQKIMGDYAQNTQVETLLSKSFSSGGQATPEVARLANARFVRTTEPNEGSRFNEGLIKQLTGGDVITARFLYGNEFEFTPSFKIWLACNYKIAVRGTDNGIWRRIRLIPFENNFVGNKADKSLEEKLTAILPHILHWAVKGTLKYLEEGLEAPESVSLATKEYRNEMNIVESFLNDVCYFDKKCNILGSLLYKNYKDWCKNNNEYCMTSIKFGREVGKKFEKKHMSFGDIFLGVCMKKDLIIYDKNSETMY